MNLRPIIGIIDQPASDSSDCLITQYGDKYLPAAYVKLVESTGARVAHIPFDAPRDVLEYYFNSVNGLLFPGGDADFTPKQSVFYEGAYYLFQLALDANKRGDYFPVIGLCQGMEMLSVMMAGSNCSVLDYDFDSDNISLPLIFNENSTSSMLWGSAPEWVVSTISTQNITFNNHNNGLPPSKYAATPGLNEVVSVISTNYDRNGKEFVSSFEGIDYPIWGLQFHPSKLAYEWNPNEVLNHSPTAIADMQYVADVLYSQAKFNFHHFPSAQEEQNALIYNTPPVFTYPVCNGFVQTYFWNYTETSLVKQKK